MSSRPIDPRVQALLDEANMLPSCAACETLLERAASAAETLGDLDTAWSARCRILGSTASHNSPRFETLFMCLAWCLAVSDAEPERFPASAVLWEYKWVVSAAPEYAAIPRGVLERIADDMDGRFIKAGWGPRAGIHKRMEMRLQTGDQAGALALVPKWWAARRDRGSDCNACEASSMVHLLAECGRHEEAVRAARPIMAGRLSCATVPHSTFGSLLVSLARLERHRDAKDLYDRGRRLVAAMDEGCRETPAYLVYAAFTGEVEDAKAMLRRRLTEASALRSDMRRAEWFGQAAAALGFLHWHGEDTIDIPKCGDLNPGGDVSTRVLAQTCRRIALGHARDLDCRNGNAYWTRWVNTRGERYGPLPNRP